MTVQRDNLAFLEHVAERFEKWADGERLNPRAADAWLAKALAMRACIREMRRLRFIETQARAIDAIFDERKDVIQLRSRVADGPIDHREHFLKLRKALEVDEEPTEAKESA